MRRLLVLVAVLGALAAAAVPAAVHHGQAAAFGTYKGPGGPPDPGPIG